MHRARVQVVRGLHGLRPITEQAELAQQEQDGRALGCIDLCWAAG